MAGESYQRAYGAMVSVQLLAELEEVVEYKINPERQPILRKLWWDRLQVRIESGLTDSLLDAFHFCYSKYVCSGMPKGCGRLAENYTS